MPTILFTYWFIDSDFFFFVKKYQNKNDGYPQEPAVLFYIK
jgi:hypothetical protein